MTTRSWYLQVNNLPANKITRIKTNWKINDAKTRVVPQVFNVWWKMKYLASASKTHNLRLRVSFRSNIDFGGFLMVGSDCERSRWNFHKRCRVWNCFVRGFVNRGRFNRSRRPWRRHIGARSAAFPLLRLLRFLPPFFHGLMCSLQHPRIEINTCFEIEDQNNDNLRGWKRFLRAPMCLPAVRVSHSARDCSRLKSLPWDRTLSSKACILYYYPLCASLGLQCSVPQSQILACLPSILVKP